MKKIIILVVILVIGVGVWWKYSSYVKGVKEGPQGDPVRTVKTFMDASVKFSGLLWSEEVKEELRRDLKEWQERTEQRKKEIPENLKKYGMEDPSGLFREKDLGKATLSALCIFHFESFSLQEKSIEKDRATIEVSFQPLDVFGIEKIGEKLGVPKREGKKEPVSVIFHLKRYWYRWYIVDVGGEVEKMTKAVRRLRRLR